MCSGLYVFLYQAHAVQHIVGVQVFHLISAYSMKNTLLPVGKTERHVLAAGIINTVCCQNLLSCEIFAYLSRNCTCCLAFCFLQGETLGGSDNGWRCSLARDCINHCMDFLLHRKAWQQKYTNNCGYYSNH